MVVAGWQEDGQDRYFLRAPGTAHYCAALVELWSWRFPDSTDDHDSARDQV